MNLLHLRDIFHTSKRFSRSSVISYRKRKALLTHFRPVDSAPSENNVYAKASADIEQIVPVRPGKTRVAIDALSQEEYAKITPWRRNQLMRRARRVLPLPISLTTDDQIGKIWQQKFADSAPGKAANKWQPSLEDIPHSIRLMFEKDLERFKSEQPVLFEKFCDVVEKLDPTGKKSDELASQDVYFPFSSSALAPINRKTSEEGSVYSESFDYERALLDKEYEDYRKHLEMVKYISTNISDEVAVKEHKQEVEAWNDQSWIR